MRGPAIPRSGLVKVHALLIKTQQIIIIIAIILSVETLFFPFYWAGQFGSDDKLIRIYLKWGLDPNMLDSLRSPEAQYIKSGHIIVVKFGTVGFIEYIKRRDIQLLEFIVIIILAASAFPGCKERSNKWRGTPEDQGAKSDNISHSLIDHAIDTVPAVCKIRLFIKSGRNKQSMGLVGLGYLKRKGESLIGSISSMALMRSFSKFDMLFWPLKSSGS